MVPYATYVDPISLSQDKDGALSQEELDELFSTSPGNPWIVQKFPETTEVNERGNVTLAGWLAQWRYYFYILIPSPQLIAVC